MTTTPTIVVAGAVLCGGRSRRMGRDKALIEVDGQPLAARVAGCLRAGGVDPVFAVGGDGHALGARGIAVVADRWPGEGPLGGILTAITTTDHAWTLVVACDLPALQPDAVATLLSATLQSATPAAPEADGTPVSIDAQVVMADSGRDEYLFAVWHRSSAAQLQRRFDNGERSIHAAIDGLRLRRVAVASAQLHNANTPADLTGG